MAGHRPPLFTAVSSSARQLFLLLRSIAFAPKAEVQITHEGLRFSVEEARVIQGLAFLEKELFTSFSFNPFPANPDDVEPEATHSNTPIFQISLAALLETLQIFGVSDPASSNYLQRTSYSSSLPNAFNTPALNLGGTCRITYADIGAPLSIILEETGVTTTCELTTYEPSATLAEDDEEESIPLQKDALTMKIIMRSAWLHNAITELSSTDPEVLVLSASSLSSPYFALYGLGGSYGDSSVDFEPETSSKDKPAPEINGRPRGKKAPIVTETFQVASYGNSSNRVRQRYRFELIKKAGRAMALASKVSIRGDSQGVLSLQFMIDLNDGGVAGRSRDDAGAYAGAGPLNLTNGQKVSFVDFRFVPLLDDEDEEMESEYEEDASADGGTQE
ncbi:MAG: hypothetical protein Q9227_000492 [Pyrenula ochraceoflavens]